MEWRAGSSLALAMFYRRVPSYFSLSYLKDLHMTVYFYSWKECGWIPFDCSLDVHLGQLDLCCSKCGSRTRGISIIWELVRDAECQAPLQPSCVTSCTFMSIPGDVSAPSSLSARWENLRQRGAVSGSGPFSPFSCSAVYCRAERRGLPFSGLLWDSL